MPIADYLPLAGIALSLAAIAVICAWPWLKAKESRDKAVTLTVVGICLSLALYLAIGNPFLVSPLRAEQAENTALLARTAELEGKDNLSAQEWAELGSVYMRMEHYAQAAEALRHAVTVSNGNPQLIMAYGKAQMLAADGNVTEGAKQAFTMASTLMPENPEPLMMLAVERMQAGDVEGGRAIFARMLPLLPEGAPLRRVILQRMKAAKAAAQ